MSLVEPRDRFKIGFVMGLAIGLLVGVWVCFAALARATPDRVSCEKWISRENGDTGR